LADVEGEIKNLTSNIQSQFSDLRSLPYRLQSIFIHRGSVSFGHYWIYIYDFTKEIWRKYNDGYVTDVKNREEIFEQEVYNPATPYFLVYVKDEAKDELVEPVCRQLAETLGDLPMEIAPIDGLRCQMVIDRCLGEVSIKVRLNLSHPGTPDNHTILTAGEALNQPL